MQGFDRKAMAARLAQDIPEGWYVNLGIGIPTMVGDFVPLDREVILHSENGILGMGPAPAPDKVDPWLVNAGKQAVTLRAGGSYCHHADSFAMIRGGHIDYCILGAMQVSAAGDLANWSTGEADAIPAVGGAMDLVAGVRHVYVITEHTTRAGEPKIVAACSCPLTGRRVVDRIYTNLAVLDVTPQGLAVRELAPGLTIEALQAVTGAPLHTAAPQTSR
jgi:3-oxoadipate CoA-transferase beta subunit